MTFLSWVEFAIVGPRDKKDVANSATDDRRSQFATRRKLFEYATGTSKLILDKFLSTLMGHDAGMNVEQAVEACSSWKAGDVRKRFAELIEGCELIETTDGCYTWDCE